jgi:hypothetical protein
LLVLNGDAVGRLCVGGESYRLVAKTMVRKNRMVNRALFPMVLVASVE